MLELSENSELRQRKTKANDLTYMWSLKTNKLTKTPSLEGEDQGNWESSTETYTLPCVKEIASEKLLHKTELNPVLRDNFEGMDEDRREVQEGGDICILTADLCCIAEINTAL